MSEELEGFEGLSEKFNIDNQKSEDDSIKDLEQRINNIEEKKNQLIQKDKSDILLDQKFLRDELKTLIMSARSVMLTLENDLKIGTPARTFEVYAKLLDSIGNQYKELRELNKTIFEAKKDMGQVDVTKIGEQKISLTADQLIDMVDSARQKSELNQIDAEFEIEDGKDK